MAPASTASCAAAVCGRPGADGHRGGARRGRTVTERITHYAVLRTIEGLYHLPHSAASAAAAPITGIWK